MTHPSKKLVLGTVIAAAAALLVACSGDDGGPTTSAPADVKRAFHWRCFNAPRPHCNWAASTS